MTFTLLGLAIAPAIAIAVYVYFRDRYEHEPLSLLAKTFVAGAVVVIPVAFIETLLFQMAPLTDAVVHVAVKNFLFVGVTEEFFKFLCLYGIAYHKKDFNEPFDGITYAVMVSMGFAGAENLLFVMNGGIHVAIVRIFTAVPAHASFAVLMGYFVGSAKFNNHKKSFLVIGVVTASLFHGAYDFFLSIDNIELIALGALAALVSAIWLSFKAMKILNQNSPFRYAAILKKKQAAQ